MSKLIRPLTAEMVGMLLFVFLGAGSIVMNGATGGALGLVGMAAVHGVGMAVLVSATMNISGGHMNPAVTFAIWLAGKIDGRTAGAYVAAQLVGAIIGAFLVNLLLPSGPVHAAMSGAAQLGPTVTFVEGVWIEAVLTFFLVSAVFGTAVSSEAPRIGGFGIGLAIFVDALVGGHLTGSMMNPARALGPAIAGHAMQGQAIYWIGPLLGAGVAALLWRAVLLPRSA
ncbi:MAG TPA: aquaporin [Gemmatimonadales bacterium]|nr:aquaporin [Gemmatimonadales bacterium]